MNYDDAIKVRNRIVSFLNADGVKRRAPRPRVAIGVGPGVSSPFQIAVRSSSKKDLERALGEGIEEELRAMALGEIEIRFTGPISAAKPVDSVSSSTLAIGASIGHYRCTAGTLGFFAQRIADGAVGFVSNNHVIADCDRGKDGDDILYPAPSDGGDRSKNVVAHLSEKYPKLDVNGTVVDAAFAELRDHVPYDAVPIGPGPALQSTPVPLFQQREVLKYGRSTGLTRGRISAFALQNLFVDYPTLDRKDVLNGYVVFNRQIEIQSDDGQRFSSPGDSGSLVVNPEGHPIALLFSGNDDGLYSYANPIDDVLRELGVRFLP
jgi:hypothetical protein